jgi:hypothetical protein
MIACGSYFSPPISAILLQLTVARDNTFHPPIFYNLLTFVTANVSILVATIPRMLFLLALLLAAN